MTASNIKKFDELTGQILGVLYEGFPVPRPLLLGDLMPGGISFDERIGFDVPNKHGEFLFASIEWLAESGYLRYKQKIHATGYTDCVLTAKGLEVLKATPDSLSTESSLGEQLVDASKIGAKSLVGDLAGQVLSIGVKFATNHFGLPG
ncbi:hypothetical protein [Pseudomonas sp. HMWF006]|uniref:hypothetical protein n=1 Tax=Pseudomonas sp. HMWF006 TaxID=2056843 RepID=UPI000D3FF9D8|nr:hypothetical protein [Pseudomonas sp. HMWF006]PTT02208.1 hypothetical protein DBR24_07285 [Pseudomonas sp. HMWF006]PTT72884.1 hypothetical protein DBR26_04255 [Pseudomonas sp. HMWF007]PTT94651.1 hypothetical protein DBR29_02855 [Pseudomonas sp. HMWF005]